MHPLVRLARVARGLSSLALLALSAALAPAPVAAQSCDPGSNGSFRFLNETLPVGSTNTEYVARIITANADGPVSFSVDQLPPGLSLDPDSGLLTGRPTSTFNDDLTFSANDGVQIIQAVVHLNVNAAGGGGNAGAEFSNMSLPVGRVGAAYAVTLSLDNGVGPFVFGAVDLPPGLTLNGLTGEVSGVPTSAGRYFASLTIVDFGEDNKVVTVLPLTVLPATSDLRFATQFLNNGEVGTSYCDAYLVENASGAVSFGASGLPEGLVLDPATGAVGGTPTVAGSFSVLLSARDGTQTITTNLSMIVAPNAVSGFHWNFFGLPTALVNVSYDRQPPILVAAEGGDAIAYSAVGLPSGTSYAAGSGELSGTPVEIGEYPITFTATDADTGEVLELSLVFLVLPPSGGDSSQISVNFWVSKESLKTGVPGRDSWRASALYNADRRTGARFDPAADPLVIQIASRTIHLDPGALAGTPQSLAWKSASGALPVEQVKLSPGKQTLSWTASSDTLTETLPTTLAQTVTLGNRGYRLLLAFDGNGAFRPALDFERTAFVVRSGQIALRGPGADTAKLSLLLADPSFSYQAGASTLRVRLLDGANVLLDRDFTALGGAARLATDARTGTLVFSFRTLPDVATLDRVAKFSYSSGKGKLSLSLAGMNLAGIPAGEAHLGVELTIGTRVYFTAVTFFERAAGSYSTTMP